MLPEPRRRRRVAPCTAWRRTHCSGYDRPSTVDASRGASERCRARQHWSRAPSATTCVRVGVPSVGRHCVEVTGRRRRAGRSAHVSVTDRTAALAARGRIAATLGTTLHATPVDGVQTATGQARSRRPADRRSAVAAAQSTRDVDGRSTACASTTPLGPPCDLGRLARGGSMRWQRSTGFLRSRRDHDPMLLSRASTRLQGLSRRRAARRCRCPAGRRPRPSRRGRVGRLRSHWYDAGLAASPRRQIVGARRRRTCRSYRLDLAGTATSTLLRRVRRRVEFHSDRDREYDEGRRRGLAGTSSGSGRSRSSPRTASIGPRAAARIAVDQRLLGPACAAYPADEHDSCAGTHAARTSQATVCGRPAARARSHVRRRAECTASTAGRCRSARLGSGREAAAAVEEPDGLLEPVTPAAGCRAGRCPRRGRGRRRRPSRRR